MTHPFLERLQSGPLLCDGATGTLIYSRGSAMDRVVRALLEGVDTDAA